jgi:hypothetical protein
MYFEIVIYYLNILNNLKHLKYILLILELTDISCKNNISWYTHILQMIFILLFNLIYHLYTLVDFYCPID